ncbi:mur ligase middle domain protein, partial [Vibrio parahaemolyticus V-223/04]
HMVKPPPQH